MDVSCRPLNGTIITPEFRANRGGLIASIEDGNDFDDLGESGPYASMNLLISQHAHGAQVDTVYTGLRSVGIRTGTWINGQNGKGRPRVILGFLFYFCISQHRLMFAMSLCPSTTPV